MEVNYITTSSFFENRIYLSNCQTADELRKSVCSGGRENKGAGIRYYSERIGRILFQFGFATQLRIGEEVFYINLKSFSKFVIRTTMLGKVGSAAEAAQRLHRLYLSRLGYATRKVKLVSTSLKRILTTGEIKDMQHLLLHLQKVALYEGKRVSETNPATRPSL